MRIDAYCCQREERALRGLAVFNERAESHRGFCHGGAMTTALDDVIGHTAILASAGPWGAVTVQVNCSLKKAVCTGQALLLQGKVSRIERRKVYVDAKLEDQNGEVYATAEGICVTGVQLQPNQTELDRRIWRFDDTAMVVRDVDSEPNEAAQRINSER